MTGETPAARALPEGVHPAWLPDAALAAVGRRRVAVLGMGPLVDTVRAEASAAATLHGGALVSAQDDPDLVLAISPDASGPTDALGLTDALSPPDALGPEAFEVTRDGGVVLVRAIAGRGLLHGWFHVVRHGEAAFTGELPRSLAGRHEPDQAIRMLDHWDNMTVHPVMGQVERGYAGDSLFYADGRVREDLSRVRAYARLLASIGITAVGVNNVNVHQAEAHLLTDQLPDLARLAEAFRPYGIRVFLSVSFAAPMTVGGLDTADPLDPGVQRWWAEATNRAYAVVPDLGGYVVKADSEGQPGPFAYGRDHADGANLLARTLAPHGGTVFWRAFVYNHRQDWRDRSTDRARAAYDHFAALDRRFDRSVVLQVKSGPIDFQVREPVSPVLSAMPGTRLAVELQVTQEYTGQQLHMCYLGPQWHEVLAFAPWGAGGPTVANVTGGRGPGARRGGIVGVSNVGTDPFWTGHPLAQANLYALGRLAWDPELDPVAVLDEWIGLTFGDDATVRATLHTVMDESWRTYERYTAPLGVGFMVRPDSHYGPDIDGYEYSPWGTYHFADRDGVGVDRTRATGTDFTGQYPQPWRDVYESLADCPDELLLFFHHVPYTHVLHTGRTVIQHIYDSHADGADQAEAMATAWSSLTGRLPDVVFARVTERMVEQVRSAREWRDQVRTYFFRESGIPDANGRPIY
jgi:alpha-glucuronidase